MSSALHCHCARKRARSERSSSRVASVTTVKKERVLVTVKTYPTLSTKYGETVVCTAGVREDGTWVRIYPVPSRPNDTQMVEP